MKYYKDSFKRRESAAQSSLGKLAAVWSTPSRYMPIVLYHCQTQGSGALLPAQAGSSAPKQALESNGGRVEYCVQWGTLIVYSCKQKLIIP